MKSRFLIISLLILILGIPFIGLPKYREVQFLKFQIEEKKKELEYKEEYLEELENLAARLKDYQKEWEKIESALPDQPSLPTLFYFFQKLSAQNGLILRGISFQGISPLEIKRESPFPLQKISFSLSLSGSYSALKNFLWALQKNARLFEIEGISFSAPGEEESFNFNLEVRTHSY
jgi:Tfp pilus assembly protein PilO